MVLFIGSLFLKVNEAKNGKPAGHRSYCVCVRTVSAVCAVDLYVVVQEVMAVEMSCWLARVFIVVADERRSTRADNDDGGCLEECVR